MPADRVALRPLAALWLGCCLLFLCFAHGNLESADSGMTMHAARSLLRHGDSGQRRFQDGADNVAEGLIAATIAAAESGSVPVYGKKGKDSERRYVWFPIGHIGAMLPCVAAGELLAAAFPGVEARYRQLVAPNVADAELAASAYPFGTFVFDHAAVAMTLPAAFAALSVVLLFLLALELGCTRRDGLLCAAAILVGTQLFPLASETLSDGPGMALLLGALLAAVRARLGTATPRALLLGGAAAGAAVLLRYQHALLVPVLFAVVLGACRRDRSWRGALLFVAGGLPFAAVLLFDDWLRFGSVFDTGYPPAGSWFNQPVWLGLTKLLIAGGKGILWFSPLLWLLLPLGASRQRVPRLRGLAWPLLLLPLLVFSASPGWQSGQCWGARYVTPGIVVFAALVLPQSQPWRHWPRTFGTLLALGALVSITSLLAPTRGHNQLAGQAVEAYYRAARGRGEITDHDLEAVKTDLADRYFIQWRYSPLHAHWTYAWQSLTGGFEDAQGNPRDGAANTIAPLFGVTSDDPELGRAPRRWEDRNFRHLWWRFWADLLAVPWWALLLPVAAAAAAMLRCGLRAVSNS